MCVRTWIMLNDDIRMLPVLDFHSVFLLSPLFKKLFVSDLPCDILCVNNSYVDGYTISLRHLTDDSPNMNFEIPEELLQSS